MFMFDLEVENLTDARGRAVTADCAAGEAWPVAMVPGRVEKRWFGIEKAYPTVLEILPEDEVGSVLAASAERDAETVALRSDAPERLAHTLRIVDRHFPEGFGFIATYSGSPIQTERSLTIDDLAALVERSALNEFTRYRVPGR